MRPTGCSHWVPQTMPSKLGTLRTVIGAWVWMSSSAATLTFRAMLPKPAKDVRQKDLGNPSVFTWSEGSFV